MHLDEFRMKVHTLYQAANNVLAKIGFEGELENGDVTTENLHEAVDDLDEGVFDTKEIDKLFEATKVSVLKGQEPLFRTELEEEVCWLRRRVEELEKK